MAVHNKIYKVRRGDTLSGIAQRELGSASQWHEIASLNKLKIPYLLIVGMPLLMPLRQHHHRQISGPPSVRAPHAPNVPPSARAPQAPSVPPPSLSAKTPTFPSLKYKVEEQAYYAMPEWEVQMKVTGEVSLQKSGAYELDFSKRGLEGMVALFKTGGVTATLDGKPFGSTDLQSVKLRNEYAGKIASIFSDASVSWDTRTRKAELKFGIGWKFGTSEFLIIPPSTYRFTFQTQKVGSKNEGLSAELAFVVEVTKRQSAYVEPDRQTVRMPVKIKQVFQEIPYIIREMRPTPAHLTAYETLLAGMMSVIMALLAMLVFV